MRSLKLLFAALLAFVAMATIAPGAHAAEGKYVALGDSYTVAVGTRSYDNPDDACRKGPTSYTRLWAAAHPNVGFVEAACSGATTADIMNSQVGQLTPDTSLVTLQVGGNDVGFVDVLKNCILTTDDADCIAGVEAAKAAATGSLSPALSQTYAAVRAAAPSAKVIVVGYPRLYTIGGNCGILGLSDKERTALNSAADTLAEIMSARSQEAGFTFLDARPVFDPHTLCSGGSEWVTSLEWDKLNESYHPNVEGHRDGYLAALNPLMG
ncbi:SGNH/GDSL hydrolase family protein [Streptomyces albidus (ex Kaewkla and Franco 2022)]|uniref:SGNH/GDSL hydrolase family protein n=1 Tax=Streptomyces albidus (ex Kaewkla and Franco 2022) TaxID=722709 RepID=UPI0015EF8449|nr:SGNH/GDSL hydrolase family protein [Streptomyces albidus (ex Kaewkla and Franco 2022)]